MQKRINRNPLYRTSPLFVVYHSCIEYNSLTAVKPDIHNPLRSLLLMNQKVPDMMKTILFYGNSNTYGYDPRSFFGDRFPRDIRWTSRLSAAAEKEWKVFADGMNGREIPSRKYELQHVFSLLREGVQGQHPDWFAVMLGTNDLFSTYPDFSADTVAKKMFRFLDQIKEAAPQVSILLIAPPVIGRKSASSLEEQLLYRESLQLGALYEQLAAQKGLTFVNTADWNIPMGFDGVHFSEEGHRLFADQMLKVLSIIEH